MSERVGVRLEVVLELDAAKVAEMGLVGGTAAHGAEGAELRAMDVVRICVHDLLNLARLQGDFLGLVRDITAVKTTMLPPADDNF